MISRTRIPLLVMGIGILLTTASDIPAFNGNQVRKGPLTITLEPIEPVTQFETPREIHAILDNTGDQPLSGQLVAESTDTIRLIDEPTRKVLVKPGEKKRISFSILASFGTYSALYPFRLHVDFPVLGQVDSPVLVFETDFPTPPTETSPGSLPIVELPEDGSLFLPSVDHYRVSWEYRDESPVHLPVGWSGSDPRSRATFSRHPVSRGVTRQSLNMHPPYRDGKGSVYAEYRVRLPESKPISLTFFNAIRDHLEHEPPSDGVTFRVWVDDQECFERHTDAKVWKPATVELSRFAGKTVLLRLESHPGPDWNTVCDSSHWGAPLLVSGEPMTVLSEKEKRSLFEENLQAIRSGMSLSEKTRLFDLGDGRRCAVSFGHHGLLDGVLGFGCAESCIQFDGLCVWVDDQPAGRWPSGLKLEEPKILPGTSEEDREPSRSMTLRHRGTVRGEAGELVCRLARRQVDQSIGFDIDLRWHWLEPEGGRKGVTQIELGPATHRARRVYAGHGYCIERPEAFRLHGGGHQLSTSHVGFDFESGLSLLMATTTPPDRLVVEPRERRYTLQVHPDTRLTFVVGTDGAMHCAKEYRPLYDKRPSAGVSRKAGRFVFDIWGGSFERNIEQMRKTVRYGVTDAMMIKHVWQRWGYDNRLPDIWPPGPQYGTTEELRTLQELCEENGILFGLHDNYIDFYPDARGYSYDHVCFTEQGTPIKAWINYRYDAQSYRWRPDRFEPLMIRNLETITSEIPLSAYFVDVFTSANVFDYYDREGGFHSRKETQYYWGRAFEVIRERLGNDAPTVSEAGDDFLIGHLAGADCQFLRLNDEPLRHNITLRCEDWTRVPWFDLVNHTRFSLHGVGYSGRYQGQRNRALFGIDSDDYISCEMLTGHALMVDVASMFKGAVRKYWLAQQVIRSIAEAEIERVEFAGGDLHRLVVHWNSGLTVYVNRGERDWKVAGHVLPPYGYFAENGKLRSCIERIDGQVVEWSESANARYVNGRQVPVNPPLPIRPSMERFEYLGENCFRMPIRWDAEGPTPKDLRIFIHFEQPVVSRHRDPEGFVGGGGYPEKPTSRWKGRVTTGGQEIALPEDLPAGRYDILVGLYDQRGNGKRYSLLGPGRGDDRYRIGTLIVERQGEQVTDIRAEKAEPIGPLFERLLGNQTPTRFPGCRTIGAFRFAWKNEKIAQLTPLPEEPPFGITLFPPELTHRENAKVKTIVAIDAEGKKIESVDFQREDDAVRFETDSEVFAYHIEWE